MARPPKTQYECSACGHESPKWLGQCPACQSWHTFEEVRIQDPSETGRHRLGSGAAIAGSGFGPLPGQGSEADQGAGGTANGSLIRITSIHDVPDTAADRIPTGISELDRILGGGFMPGSYTLLGGDPGIGKSTLTLQLAGSMPSVPGRSGILYIAGEESPHQIRQRAVRVGVAGSSLHLFNGTEISTIVDAALATRPTLLIVDSIQTLYSRDLSGLPGSVQQIRECASVLQQLAKREHVTVLLIGHVTKEGDIAGPRLLEHMVDTVLQFEGDPLRMVRMLRSVKNRFGPAQEVAVFEMTGSGLREVENPSDLFLSDHDDRISGRAITCVMEGSRPLLVEIQALVSQSGYATPQRMTAGFDQRRLSLILAVLERRAGLSFAGKDVYVSVAGGFKVQDPAADGAVAVALASALWDLATPSPVVVMGEVGLGGEMRPVPMLPLRIQESTRLGYADIVSSRPPRRDGATPQQAIWVKYVSEAMKAALRA